MIIIDQQGLLLGSDATALNLQRALSSALPNIGTGVLTVADTAYFVYLGKVTQDFTPKYVEFVNTVAAGGGGAAEVGLFSTPLAPNKGAQSVAKLVSGLVTANSLAATGIFRNATGFATAISRGVHLWAGLRSSYQGPQATMSALCADFGEGRILTTATASSNGGILTAAGPWNGSVPAINTTINTGIGPDLRCVMD